MACMCGLLLFFLAWFPQLSSSLYQNLSSGSSLSVEDPTHILISPNIGNFSSRFYKVADNAYSFAVWFRKPSCIHDCSLILNQACRQNCTLLWMANPDHPVNAKSSKLELLTTGNLVLKDASKLAAWSTDTFSSSAVHLNLKETGNLVLESSGFGAGTLWQSVDFPTDTLLPNQLFTRDMELVSSRSRDYCMASQLVREWTGIQQFPPATQTKLIELLGQLKQENVSTLTILVMGKGGVGKSSTVNSIMGEKSVAVSTFQSEGPRPVMVSRSRAGFTLNIIDTPGLIDGGYVNDQALEITKRFLLNKTIDVLLYVDRLDAYRVDNLDRQVVKAITVTFGKQIWNRALVVLTHAQLSPPDGLNYDVFFSKRSETLIKLLHSGAGIKKPDNQENVIPVVLVENSGRCNKNDSDEKILPDGTAWIPNLVRTIAEVVLNGSEPVLVDKKLIEGPNPNERGKILIPLIALFQYLFIVKPIMRAIKSDIGIASKPAWNSRDVYSRRF